MIVQTTVNIPHRRKAVISQTDQKAHLLIVFVPKANSVEVRPGVTVARSEMVANHARTSMYCSRLNFNN